MALTSFYLHCECGGVEVSFLNRFVLDGGVLCKCRLMLCSSGSRYYLDLVQVVNFIQMMNSIPVPTMLDLRLLQQR